MIQSTPYDPELHDLFLYEDHVISWTVPSAGSTTVKRPYAWNPNSVLYGYRRSLEGICAPYRTFSTQYAGNPANAPVNSNAYQSNLVNPKSVEKNRPLWWNSFPPTHYMISKRLMMTCAHCFGIELTDRAAILNSTFADLYVPNGYLDAVTVLRFIDGYNNVIEVDKTTREYPYVYDSNNGFPPNASVAGKTVSTGYADDCAISAGQQDFPYNPVTLIDAGSVPYGSEWFYLNAGNMTIQRVVCRITGGNVNVSGATKRGMQLFHVTDYDELFLHDSGSLFLYPLRAPTSLQAGDGIMGVSNGHIYTLLPNRFYKAEWFGTDIPKISPDPPYQGLFPLYQPTQTTREQNLQDFRDYWRVIRGHPYPSLVPIGATPNTAFANASQINALAETVSSMLTYVTP